MAGDEEPTPDVSRRDALKKIGIGAGIAWSAPVVLSFYNAAGAATGTPESPTTPSTRTRRRIPDVRRLDVRSDVVPCSSTQPRLRLRRERSDPNSSFCVPGSTPCAIGPACAPDLTCPPGFFCAIDTCCGTNVCAPFSIARQLPARQPDGTVTSDVAPIGATRATGTARHYARRLIVVFAPIAVARFRRV